ncbi:universal stress protein [Oxalobacteraceae bacterium]|nr:universal stress protein [Oxalobacteraceae bacterium]
MFKTILLPTDGSELSDRATAIAIEFAVLHRSRLVALHVIQPLPFPPVGEAGMLLDGGAYQRQMEEQALRTVDKVALAARAAEVPFEGVIKTSTSPSDEIVAAATFHNCELIMMASHGRSGLNRFLLGSETQKVLAHTTLPVMVLR